MRHHGLQAQVLPPSDEESLSLGKQLCLGKECLPCFTCIGDLVKQSRRPGFDAAQSILFMPTTAGPCRFGQYRTLQRALLNENGLGDVEIISPSAENSYMGFGKNSTQLRLLIWQGIVAVDLLLKLLHTHRPYELTAGSAEKIYWESVHDLSHAIEAGGGKKAVAAMERAAASFRALPVNRQERRPIIGLVGEIYLRANRFTNREIVRKVEALGGEVWVAPLMEWLYYTNAGSMMRNRVFRRYTEYLKLWISDQVQRYDEARLFHPIADLLSQGHDTAITKVMEYARPYYDPELGTEAVLSIGKTIDFARLGAAGVIHVMPLNCMPGTISTAICGKVRQDYQRIPWLNLIYDGQEDTNINTRLEAFMYQARQYRQRTEN
jgi:predicted nucleotide-binding protein (sugar kinase/HSP70/actin superfamily)